MSSHREAPAISKDPVADNTDVYAFVDPNDSSQVTILANFIPLEEPAGGPNFFTFGDDVLYEILIDNNGDGVEDVTYQFRFKTLLRNPNTFLYNTGPITSLDSPSWNMRQVYSVTRVVGSRRKGKSTVLASNLVTPPVRIGPRSTPGYAALANAAINDIGGTTRVFAGQRDEGFNVDLGSIFDLGTLRPFQGLHLIPNDPAPGVDASKGFNVHSIALQVPKTALTRGGRVPTDPTASSSVVGIWAAASRQKALVRSDDEDDDDEGDGRKGAGFLGGDDDDDDDDDHDDDRSAHAGPWRQVSRLGNPLINEVIIPLGKKDRWNTTEPKNDSQFLRYYTDPELQNLLPVLYPTAFGNLAALLTSPPASRPRNDLVAILLTGIPSGIIPGFQNFTGSRLADMLRLNLAIPPTTQAPSEFGLLGGDPAGFPNGRRVFDNIVAIELRAVAGLTYPLVAPTYVPDGAAGVLTDDTANESGYLPTFPYLALPHEGYEHKHD